MTSEYAKADHRVLLLDSYAEIIDCREEIKLMRKDISALRLELNALLQTAHENQTLMLKMQHDIPIHVGNAAMEAFETQLNRAQDKLNEIQSRPWWKFW